MRLCGFESSVLRVQVRLMPIEFIAATGVSTETSWTPRREVRLALGLMLRGQVRAMGCCPSVC